MEEKGKINTKQLYYNEKKKLLVFVPVNNNA